eukprot:1481516-Pyramimonas_sp.AAC.1
MLRVYYTTNSVACERVHLRDGLEDGEVGVARVVLSGGLPRLHKLALPRHQQRPHVVHARRRERRLRQHQLRQAPRVQLDTERDSDRATL